MRIDGAVLDDAPVVQLAKVSCSARSAAVISRSSASRPVHSAEQACMLNVSAVAPHQRPEFGRYQAIGLEVGAEAAMRLGHAEPSRPARCISS